MPDTVALTFTETYTEGTSTQTEKRTFTVADATITQSIVDKTTIAAGATNQALDFDNLASVLYLRLQFSGAVTVRIGSNTAPALSFAANGYLVIAASQVSSVYITNSGATPVTVSRFAATP